MADTKEEEQQLSKKELKALKKEEKKAKKGEKKGGGFVKLVLIFLIILGAIYALLYFDVFGIRSKHLNNVIQDTPLVNLFPPVSEEDAYTRGDLLNEVNTLKAENEKLQTELDDANARIESQVSQISSLTPLADEQIQFKQDKEQFDKMIAEGDKDAFSAFYEKTYPDTAKEVYASIVTEKNDSKLISDYVARFSAMDESSAAGILEIMVNTDLDLVVSILDNMSAEKSGQILAAMPPESAATVVKRMAPVMNN